MTKKGEIGWNRGLTKETHPGLKKMSEKLTGRTKETHPGVKCQSEKITGRTKEIHPGVKCQSEKITGRTKENDDSEKRMADKMRGRTKENDEGTRRQSEKMKGRNKENNEGRRKQADKIRGRTKETHEGNRRQSEKMAGRTKETYEPLKRVSEAQKCNWQDPEFVKMMLKSWNTKPTRPEKTIDELLKCILPGEYELNVFGKTVLAGKIPDFVNINGKKKAIEFNGCYFHKCPDCFGGDGDKTTAERVELFKQYGWDTLVIWEHEMDDMIAVTNKILGFHDLPFISVSRQLSLFDCEVKNVI